MTLGLVLFLVWVFVGKKMALLVLRFDPKRENETLLKSLSLTHRSQANATGFEKLARRIR